MIDRNAQVGWTDAQWNRVRQAVVEEWQKVRVAGSVLPTYGPLPPSTEVVPSELVDKDGNIEDAATARIVELAATVVLSGQQVSAEDLSDAVLLFRRAATALARTEDQVIFNGQLAVGDDPWFFTGLISYVVSANNRFPKVIKIGGEPALRHATELALQKNQNPLTPADTALRNVFTNGLRLERTAFLPAFAEVNPGALGLVVCAGTTLPRPNEPALKLSGHELVTAISEAIASLESQGYGAPFVCFLGQNPFVKAHEPTGDSMVLPADRIEPLVGRDLVRAPALDFPPPPNQNPDQNRGRGIVVSLAGDSIDIVMAVEATPQFTQVTAEGKYAFRVYERFALRVKDDNAIVLIEFKQPDEREKDEQVEAPQKTVDAVKQVAPSPPTTPGPPTTLAGHTKAPENPTTT